MRVIGVIDLAGGRAVHARAGARARYRPVASPLLDEPGDALALARAYHERFRLDELYVADLDALAGGAPQWPLLGALAATVPRLLVDAGIAEPARAREALAHGATRVVVPLETLPAFDALAAVVDDVGGERVAFGLDLRHGEPLLRAGAAHRGSPIALAERAWRLGARAAIVLDLARVGTGAGLDEALLAAVRERCPTLELLAGGGVRDRVDLERLAARGCDGALVATALLDGRLAVADVDAVRLARAPHAAHPNVSR